MFAAPPQDMAIQLPVHLQQFVGQRQQARRTDITLIACQPRFADGTSAREEEIEEAGEHGHTLVECYAPDNLLTIMKQVINDEHLIEQRVPPGKWGKLPSIET